MWTFHAFRNLRLNWRLMWRWRIWTNCWPQREWQKSHCHATRLVHSCKFDRLMENCEKLFRTIPSQHRQIPQSWDNLARQFSGQQGPNSFTTTDFKQPQTNQVRQGSLTMDSSGMTISSTIIIKWHRIRGMCCRHDPENVLSVVVRHTHS